MSAVLASPEPGVFSPEPRTLNPEPSSADQPTATASRKLPPSERDFEIYEAVHVGNCSTWSQARKYEISQTRVRQIIRRVVEWLGEVLPPQAKVAREQEVHLARQIAAGRYQHQLEEATLFWNETRELKYAGLRMRLTAAQARLGVVGGIIDGLAADAIDGIPVPAWQAPAEPDHAPGVPSASAPAQGCAPADSPASDQAAERSAPAPRSRDDDIPAPFTSREELERAVFVYKFQLILHDPNPPDLANEVAAARRKLLAAGFALDDDGKQTVAAEAGSPPIEDCSHTIESSSERRETTAPSADETHGSPAAYDNNASPRPDLAEPHQMSSQPLLTAADPLPVAVLQLAPNQPGAALSRSCSTTSVVAAHSQTQSASFSP